MNRPFKFRQVAHTVKPSVKKGKVSTKTGKDTWHYFGLIDGAWVSPTNVKNQIFQFIGIHDKFGKEIYEGDFLKDGSGVHKMVEYNNQKASFWSSTATTKAWSMCEVVGNVIDNPNMAKLVK